MASISLTTGMRNSLFSLGGIQENIDKTNNRLSTGKKVNSALDNALNFFTAEGFSSRSRALTSINENIALGINVLKQADKGLDSIKRSLEQVEGTLKAALQNTGQNAKAVSNFSFTGANALLAESGTGSINRFQVNDQIQVQLGAYSATGFFTAASSNTALTIGAGTTVQNLLDQINNFTGFNPAAQEPRVYAYLSDGGNIVVENTNAAGATTTLALQFVVTNSGTGTFSGVTDLFTLQGGKDLSIQGTTSTTQGISGGTTANLVRRDASNAFREVIGQISNTARDAGYNGTNILNGDSSRVAFNEDDTTSVTTRGTRLDAVALGFLFDNATTSVGDSLYNFQSDREIKLSLNKITAAKTQVDGLRSLYATNLNILQNRESFTKDSIRFLNDGVATLTLADINEEGATLSSLQTRQQLAVTALSLANQADQAILRLF
jgi:flagellin-like hook-associated protein FlgL